MVVLSGYLSYCRPSVILDKGMKGPVVVNPVESPERGEATELNDSEPSMDYNRIQDWKGSHSELDPQEAMVSRKVPLNRKKP